MNERLSNRSVHGDGLSSTQLVTDDTGAQAARIVYGAWGEQLSVNDSVPGGLDVRFVGGLGVRNDSASGLIYMRHRWYDQQLGRFLSRDPIGFEGGYNLYEYARGNSPKFVDPQGLDVVGSKFFQTAAQIGGPPIAQAVRTRNPWVIGGAVVGAAGAIGVYYWYAGGDDDSGEQVPQKTTLIPYGGELLTPEQLMERLKNRPKPKPKPPTPKPPTPPGGGGDPCWDDYQTSLRNLDSNPLYKGTLYRLAKDEIDKMYRECGPGWKPPCDHKFWPKGRTY